MKERKKVGSSVERFQKTIKSLQFSLFNLLESVVIKCRSLDVCEMLEELFWIHVGSRVFRFLLDSPEPPNFGQDSQNQNNDTLPLSKRTLYIYIPSF